MRFPLPLGVDKNPLHYTRLALLMGHYSHDAAARADRWLSAAGNGYSTNQFRCVQRVLDRATFEIERAEEEPAFTKLVYLEGSSVGRGQWPWTRKNL